MNTHNESNTRLNGVHRGYGPLQVNSRCEYYVNEGEPTTSGPAELACSHGPYYHIGRSTGIILGAGPRDCTGS